MDDLQFGCLHYKQGVYPMLFCNFSVEKLLDECLLEY